MYYTTLLWKFEKNLTSIVMNDIATTCVHAGASADPTTGAVIAPIYQTSTYVQKNPGEPLLYDYARAGNPTRTSLEQALAALEGGKHAYTFSSGLAAVQAVIQLLDPQSQILVCQDVYGGSGRLFTTIMGKYGLTFEFIDMRDPQQVSAAIKPTTRMIWLETPTNPLLQLIDIEKIVAVAKDRQVITVVDNTFASPIFQLPLAQGADIVVHSTTKYIGGHSDLIGGAVITSNDQLADKIKFFQFAGGAVNSPFEAFLLLRSIKTLWLRMQRHHDNAMQVARILAQHDKVQEVIYPGLPSHPQYDLAKKQMTGYSGIISMRLQGDLATVKNFFAKLRLFQLAESLGGVESLINHPETMTHASVPVERRQKLKITSDLIRLSVGIENADDLVDDLLNAL